jgi:hypothetical protein
MRIQVKSQGYNISIPIPTRLIFSKPAVWIYLKFARSHIRLAEQYIPEGAEISLEPCLSNLPEEAVYAICSEILRIKRTYGRWELLEVHSADGAEICITL